MLGWEDLDSVTNLSEGKEELTAEPEGEELFMVLILFGIIPILCLLVLVLDLCGGAFRLTNQDGSDGVLTGLGGIYLGA